MTPEEKKDWKPEKFPEPRTFPSEWYMSGLMAASEKSAAKEEADEWKPEPFPQPRTFPKGWHFDDKS
ncbi:MAG: hypothetical protein ISS57_19255 [Anaerolineales bacterium]|nr:hypothetical protein [Chloroflexota bacterium]MBL7164731.1 hypothetical protein [Anaerolineales bacterium]